MSLSVCLSIHLSACVCCIMQHFIKVCTTACKDKKIFMTERHNLHISTCDPLKFKIGNYYSKTCVKRPLSKRPKIGFQDQLSLNAGQKYCRMLQGEHSAILSNFIKLPFLIKIFVLSIFEWPFYTGFTVLFLTSWENPSE